ncbi:Carbon monoxide dehydrogenase medium chain [Pigmentiphaga humi]|uniref:Carbon monoxide dehydrogenase medium chain n=1 Tax=Pigmentiphaga humi TaxID=2478468 RepID=A0A3P4B7B6_9BURK|nr:xanthine dehydrogenase family protein subunit M [Pigmentiphaga humi]VCU71500.1 Carbon monoxide dehydrogenase medium chain [Pigmentiphaga humi]
MYATHYARPNTLDEAIALLKDHPEARPLSGGMTLIPTLKQRLAAPSHLVDLSRLDELRGIAAGNGTIRIGAATRHAEVARSPQVARAVPALSCLAGQIADPQVRNRGTLGGSLANNDPAADYPSAVLGLAATVLTTRRAIAADDYFLGMFETALEPGELIVAVEFPIVRQAGYLKYRHPASGYAVAGVFIALADNGVRVAITGAGPCVFRWEEAEDRLSGDFSVGALDGLRLDPAELLGDPHAPPRYRANLVEVQTRRLVAQMTSAPVELRNKPDHSKDE